MVGDVGYYNGFVFKGYVENVPAAVLSGGQYDRLMAKMNRDSRAIGFAVYLDLLERLNEKKADYDCDILVLYSDKTDISSLVSAVDSLVKSGCTVSVRRSADNVKYKKLIRFD